MHAHVVVYYNHALISTCENDENLFYEVNAIPNHTSPHKICFEYSSAHYIIFIVADTHTHTHTARACITSLYLVIIFDHHLMYSFVQLIIIFFSVIDLS